MTDGDQSARPKQHQFIHIRSLIDIPEPEIIVPTSTKTKDKKKKSQN